LEKKKSGRMLREFLEILYVKEIANIINMKVATIIAHIIQKKENKLFFLFFGVGSHYVT
jgi:hypothetical protein